MVFPGVFFLIMWLKLIERLQVLQAQRAEEAFPHFPWVIQGSHGSIPLNPHNAGASCQESAGFLHKEQGSGSISLAKQHTDNGEVASWPWMGLPLWSKRSLEKGNKRGGLSQSGKLAGIENFLLFFFFHNSIRVFNVCSVQEWEHKLSSQILRWKHKNQDMRTSQDNGNSIKWETQILEAKKGKFNFNSKHNTKAILQHLFQMVHLQKIVWPQGKCLKYLSTNRSFSLTLCTLTIYSTTNTELLHLCKKNTRNN